MTFILWALLGSFALSGLLAIAWVSAIDREQDRPPHRQGRRPLPVARALEDEKLDIGPAQKKRWWS